MGPVTDLHQPIRSGRLRALPVQPHPGDPDPGKRQHQSVHSTFTDFQDSQRMFCLPGGRTGRPGGPQRDQHDRANRGADTRTLQLVPRRVHFGIAQSHRGRQHRFPLRLGRMGAIRSQPVDNPISFVSNTSLFGNSAIYYNPTVQACVNAMTSTSNISAIQTLCKPAQAQIYNDAPYAWIGQITLWGQAGGSLVWTPRSCPVFSWMESGQASPSIRY